ncbi:MAG: class I SAM-dependent methyltransferase [Bdellovibrionales bacterium]|nr:class I SAM-dependent methyltransferase [Bdellovibrionales bacterium]
MKNVLELGRPTRFLSFSALDDFCRKRLLEKLEAITLGRLEIVDLDGSTRTFGSLLPNEELRARVVVRRGRAYSRIALGGSVGTGESYVDGDWECSDLVSLTRLFVANRDVLNALDGGLGTLFAPLQKFLHRLRANDESQARANIHAHYDLGNDFFSLFLDESWMYSAGFFRTPATTLPEAQFEKNDRICRKLGLRPEHHLLEIGTGWGGFAIHAAKHYGCRVTTTTISSAQLEHARARVEAEGLGDRIELLSADYRSLSGTYDRLVSIEMVEAVGVDYLDGYFAKCASLLKPEGAMCLQSILIQDQYFDQAVRNVDFIQTHIFPGAAIPSVARIMESILRKTDLRLFHHEDFGPDYARTLREWSKNLAVNREQIGRRGYPDHLYRLWQYYFAYCEGGFLERQIGVGQFVFTKPRYRGEKIGESV